MANSQNSKPEKWTADQMERLIDAYKEERCLYATDLKSYHNRVLRSKALDRVAAAVRTLRPSTNPKECFKKLHALRNCFSIENSKVKTAQNEGGSGEDDMYEPSLWYYPKLLFLDTYLQPKKKKRLFSMQTSETQDSTQGTSKSFVPPQANWKCESTKSLQEASVLEHIAESEDDDRARLLSQRTDAPDSVTAFPSPLPVAQPTTSTPAPPQDRVTKRKLSDSRCDEEDDPSETESSTKQNPKASSTESSCSVDPVDAFVSFIGSLLHSFQDEELKLEVMNSISQTVFDAKSIDIKRQNN